MDDLAAAATLAEARQGATASVGASAAPSSVQFHRSESSGSLAPKPINSLQSSDMSSKNRKMTPYSLEVAAMVRHLIENSGSRSPELLRSLRKTIKKGGQLPDGEQRIELFQVFYYMLGDVRWKVVCEATMLMVDIIPQMGDFELDHCLTLVLPRVVPNLGHESTDVRRASLRLLHVYMRYTNNLQKVLRTYVQCGLESPAKAAQKGAVLSLPLLFTEEFSNENLYPLVQALATLLVNSDTNLFYPVFLALQRLHVLVGNANYKLYLEHVSPDARLLYQKVSSRNSTANSGGRSETGNIFDHPNSSEENNNDEPAISMQKLIACGDIPKPMADSNDAVAGSFDTASVDTSVFEAPDFAYSLDWGLFSKSVLSRALSDSFPERVDGLNSMVTLVRNAPTTQMALFSSHLDDFLSRFLSRLFEDSNFKINLFGLDMILAISERLKINAINYMRPMVGLLFKRLGDSRAVVRDHTIKVAHGLMFNFPPQPVLDTFLEQKYHRNPKVREEVANRVTGALLTFPRSEFQLPKLCYEIAPMLVDHKRMVRLAALECLAVLSHSLGHSNLSPLYGAVQTVENTCDSEGLFNAVQARLARRDLPRVSADGAIRYVLNPATFSGWFPTDSDADIEWVMLASSSNSGTPPKFPSSASQYYNSTSRYVGRPPAGGHGPGQRKGSIRVNPVNLNPVHQVSFEQTDISSDNGQRTDDAVETNMLTLQRRRATPVADADMTLPDVSSRQQHRSKEIERGLSTSSSNGSLKSDDSKGRELWRYYFRKFKQHITGTTSSASSAERSRTANYSKANGRRQSDHRVTIDARQRPLSASSSASGDSGGNRHEIPVEDSVRQNRALSMPTISGQLSDISEMSHDESTRTVLLNPGSNKVISSVPSTPEKSKNSLEPHGLDRNRSMSVSEPQQLLLQTPSPRKSLNVEGKGSPRPSSASKEQGGEGGSRPASRGSKQHKRSPSPAKNKKTAGEDVLSAPTSRPSTAGSRPATPVNRGGLEPQGGLRRMSTVTGSMPVISLPRADSSARDDDDDHGDQGDGVKDSISLLDMDTRSEATTMRDAQTQKDADSELSTTSTDAGLALANGGHGGFLRKGAGQSKTLSVRRRGGRARVSRSISPVPRSHHHHQSVIRMQPAIPANANIRNILGNVAKTEGSFSNPEEAMKAALTTFTQDSWATKVEGMLAITRLATFHPHILQREMHTVVCALVYEVKNLRSSVARSAIFTIGELFVKMKKQVEPDMDSMGQALLLKCGENVTFIREDIDKALTNMIDEMPQSKCAITLITNGANHRNSCVRRTTGQYLSALVERMGPNKCLMGPRDIAEHLLPAAARFVSDGSPNTRYYGRKIFSVVMSHAFFDKLLRKFLSPGTFRNIVGILESIKRRGIGDRPPDLPTKG